LRSWKAGYEEWVRVSKVTLTRRVEPFPRSPRTYR
jgi:hypothetical protein